MYLMPLWSGVLLNLDEKIDQQTRVHNHFVEGKFKINKCSILNRLRDNMPHEISTKFLKDVATKSLSYNIENSKSQYLLMDLIEDYWGKNEQQKRNTCQTQNDLTRIKEKLLDKEFKAKASKAKNSANSKNRENSNRNNKSLKIRLRNTIQERFL